MVSVIIVCILIVSIVLGSTIHQTSIRRRVWHAEGMQAPELATKCLIHLSCSPCLKLNVLARLDVRYSILCGLLLFPSYLSYLFFIPLLKSTTIIRKSIFVSHFISIITSLHMLFYLLIHPSLSMYIDQLL